MNPIRWLIISFTLYSAVPMPRLSWKEEDMACSLTFFPLVGALIGGACFLLNCVSPLALLPVAARILLTLAIPLILTGGIHLDGFMDTEDALHSYGSPEKKLEILKDPHIGAFAILSLLKWMLVLAAAVTVLVWTGGTGFPVHFCLCFVVSRALSGLTSLGFKKAKDGGMLAGETKGRKKIPAAALILQLLAAVGGMLAINPLLTGALVVCWALCIVLYRRMAYRQFGGVTGDTAGFFLTVTETASALVLAVYALCMG